MTGNLALFQTSATVMSAIILAGVLDQAVSSRAAMSETRVVRQLTVGIYGAAFTIVCGNLALCLYVLTATNPDDFRDTVLYIDYFTVFLVAMLLWIRLSEVARAGDASRATNRAAAHEAPPTES